MQFTADDIKIFRTVSSVTAHTYKVTLIQYKVGVLLTVWNLIPTKLDYLHLQEKLIQLTLITNCVTNVKPIPLSSEI